MLPKADTEAVRRQNRRIAMEHVRRWQSSTRRRLAQETGLSLSGASAIAGDLVRDGFLVEAQAPAGARRGRPEITLTIAPGAARVAVVKIAVGAVSASVADYCGRVLAVQDVAADLMTLAADGLVDLVAQTVGTVLDATRTHGPLRLVVVAVQGVADAGNTMLLWSPIAGTRNIELGGPLRQRFGAPVVVMNDCGLMPERFRWTPEGAMRDFATLFIGFGVGMGLRLDGRTFRGSHSSAVEFGHMNHIPGGAPCRCGNLGCIEAYAGDYAIFSAARGDALEDSPGRPASDGEMKVLARRVSDGEMKVLADAARAGDRRAIAAFEQAGEALGYGLGRLFTMIDPLPITFVGSGALAMDLLEPSIRRAIRRSAIEGVGADIPFLVYPDVDTILLEASIAFALATVDDLHAVPGSGAPAQPALQVANPV